jgi:hypothetical protein
VNFSRETMLELMAFADDELEGDAKARVEALLAESAEARGVVASFRTPHLGRGLGEAFRARADAAHADDIAATVLRRLGISAAPPVPVSLAARLSGPRARARSAIFVAGGVLALAAAVAIVLRASHLGSGGSLREAHVGASSGQWVAPLRDVPSAPLPDGVEVRAVDAPSRTIEVLAIPVASAAASPAAARSRVVIWVDDDGAPR